MEQYESPVDKAIRLAQERGEFDDLPGAGKPIPGLDKRHDANWWLRQYVEREQISVPLGGALGLRKEVEDLPATLAEVRTEAAARQVVEDLNARILRDRHHPAPGPEVFVRTVDVEAALDQWRTRPDRRGAWG